MKIQEALTLVSVLTTVKNGGRSIADTIDSVINQSYLNIEYIIIDGGSTDDTVAIVQAKSNSRIKFFIETDNGVYYGMNNAISKAGGDLIAILNSGDAFVNNKVLERIVEIYQSSPEKDLVINGGIMVMDESGNTIQDVVRKPSVMKWKYFIMPVNHPAFFVARSVYDKYSAFNTTFKIGADYEFVLRLFKKNVRFIFIGDICTKIAPPGISSYENNIYRQLEECYAIRALYMNVFYNKSMYLLQWLFFIAHDVKKRFK